MGHHGDLKASAAIRPASVDRARAVLAVALIGLAPDGQATASDLTRLQAVLVDAPLLDDLAPLAIEELARLTLRSLACRGADRVLDDLHGLIPPRLAETALVLALRAAVCDGRVPVQRATILRGLAERLGVAMPIFAEMLSVIAMLERPAV